MDYVFSTAANDVKRYNFPTHINDLVMDRAVSTTSEVFIVIIKKDGAPPLHKHDDTEQVFYVVAGEGELTIGEEAVKYPVKTGDIVRIPPSTWHSIKCTAGDGMKYISVDCFINGRPTEEPTWDAHVKVVCDIQGWDFDSIAQ